MPVILAIESSCDETSAAVIRDGHVRSNVISSQPGHGKYGGVVPELASRLHMQNIVRVVDEALETAGVTKTELDAVGFTRGPGLMGALLVGVCFAKSFAWALDVPLIEVDHMQAHVMANFLKADVPEFPFLCLTVSGGHTQLVIVKQPLEMRIVGSTIDDAAGEAFDKAAKMLGFPYPGGPWIDRLAKEGNADAFTFTRPDVGGYDFSFSGIKTQLLYLLRDGLKRDADFVERNRGDLCASWQKRIVTLLMEKTEAAAKEWGVNDIALAGGVAANSGLRKAFAECGVRNGWKVHIPDFEFCTDNAAMIGMAAHHKYVAGRFTSLDAVPFVRGEAGELTGL